MKIIPYILIACVLLTLSTSCKNQNSSTQTEENEEHHHEATEEGVHINEMQFSAMDMVVDSVQQRSLSGIVEANGQLEVPPQNEAVVTTILGANIASIKVIEGDAVKKGQVLAYIAHPNLTSVQSDYLEAHNNLLYLEQDQQRLKKLYNAGVESGKSYQKITSEYRSASASVKSYESQLRQLGISPSRIQNGNFYDMIPVTSPIDGVITKVQIKTGQYVQPERELFEIVNTEHIHADLMVFEKDVHKVESGQRVRFTVQTLPDTELYATIYSVGKKFEENPKALHIHADIENKTGKLIPGLYINGEIITGTEQVRALPSEAITRENGKFYAFIAQQEENKEWSFRPVEVIPGMENEKWTAVSFLEKLPNGTMFAQNNAYYLMAEMKKGEAEHSH